MGVLIDAIFDYFRKKIEEKEKKNVQILESINDQHSNGNDLPIVPVKRYDIYGFDQYNWSREGIHRVTLTVYDENGFNQYDFDQNGFHKFFGFDLEGYDRDGYDVNGFDVNGIDENGFNREGIHTVTFTKYDKYGLDQEGLPPKNDATFVRAHPHSCPLTRQKAYKILKSKYQITSQETMKSAWDEYRASIEKDFLHVKWATETVEFIPPPFKICGHNN